MGEQDVRILDLSDTVSFTKTELARLLKALGCKDADGLLKPETLDTDGKEKVVGLVNSGIDEFQKLRKRGNLWHAHAVDISQKLDAINESKIEEPFEYAFRIAQSCFAAERKALKEDSGLRRQIEQLEAQLAAQKEMTQVAERERDHWKSQYERCVSCCELLCVG